MPVFAYLCTAPPLLQINVLPCILLLHYTSFVRPFLAISEPQKRVSKAASQVNQVPKSAQNCFFIIWVGVNAHCRPEHNTYVPYMVKKGPALSFLLCAGL